MGAVGRPRIKITDHDLARVLTGKTTAVDLARELGCNRETIGRRLREMKVTAIA